VAFAWTGWNDWTGWSDEAKPWDPKRPFHRIHSGLYKPAEPRASGDGYERGCRVPDEIPFVWWENLFRPFGDIRTLIRSAPSWVDVKDERELMEVEGVLVRSFQTWTDFPLFQWHHWYDWNFHILPAEGFRYLAGEHNHAPEALASDEGFTQPVVRPLEGRGMPYEIECEWDCGVFNDRQRTIGPMFGAHRAGSNAAAEDWCWPMTGHQVWIRGRWIYDCGHPSNNRKVAPNQGKTRSELHPCHAVATARWEAVAFPENGDVFVPAIQFMFFATRLGGYSHRDALDGGPYEFIVDLPPLAATAASEHAIGRTPRTALNTIALRPRLLTKLNPAPFEVGRRYTVLGAAGVQIRPARGRGLTPRVELVEPLDPEKPQARVTISLDEVRDHDLVGTVLSLGWFDADGSQARRVKRVRVRDFEVRVGSNDHDATGRGSGEWVVKLGVNGRWVMRHVEDVGAHDTIRFDGVEFDFHLSDHEWNQLFVSCHGEELDDVHDVFKDRSDSERVLRRSGSTPYRYDGDIQRPEDLREPNQDDASLRLKGAARSFRRELVSRIRGEFSLRTKTESDPLGRIDPFHGEGVNPLGVTGPADKGPQRYSLKALVTGEVGDSAELAEKPGTVDYTLNYTVEITSQRVA
jgi:hypothetical protein